MAIKLITGTTGSAHITPLQDSMWHRSLQGVSDCILDFGNNMEAVIQTNNVVRVKDGIASVQGRYVCIEPNAYEDVTIDNGSQGNNRIDVICIKITVNAGGTQSASLVAVKGTPTTATPTEPTIPEGSLDDGDTEVYMPLASVTLSGISIDSVTRKAVKLSETALNRTLDSVLCSDVLEFAEKCQKGITSFYTGESTTNIPNVLYRYSSGFVHRRGPEQITVFLYAYNSSKIAINTYFAGTWSGWSTIESKELLWTNASPTSSFSAQTISLDLSRYDAVEIVCRYGATDDTRTRYMCDVGSSTPMYWFYYAGTDGKYTGVRSRNEVSVSTTGVTFDTCTGKSGNSSTSTANNGYIIPIEIYGIKGV